jgi:hypothetical protein
MLLLLLAVAHRTIWSRRNRHQLEKFFAWAGRLRQEALALTVAHAVPGHPPARGSRPVRILESGAILHHVHRKAHDSFALPIDGNGAKE